MKPHISHFGVLITLEEEKHSKMEEKHSKMDIFDMSVPFTFFHPTQTHTQTQPIVPPAGGRRPRDDFHLWSRLG